MAEGLSLQRIEALSRGALPEVREFITRKLGCSHWDEADKRPLLKTAEVKRALRHLRCSELATDEAFLRRTYAGHSASINALDAAQGTQTSAPAPAPRTRPPRAAGF